MSKSSEAVKKWRYKTKGVIIQSMGGCCQICKYNKCNNALELHHLDPDKKDFSFGSIRANPCSNIKIAKELYKCILLCSNCHREIHHGVTKIPLDYNKFNENLFKELSKHQRKESKCPVCNNDKPLHNKTCSYSCAGKITKKKTVDWESYNLVELLEKNNGNKTKVGEVVGCSGAAVLKRMRKMGIT